MSAITGTAFIAKALLYGGVAVEDANNDLDQSLVWISQSIVNRHSEVCELMNKWTDVTDTVNSDKKTIDIPTDWDWVADIELYSDTNYENTIDFDIKAGKIWLDSERAAGGTVYIRYRLAPNEYTAVSTSIVETANPRLLKILMDEFLGMFVATDNDLENSSQESSLLKKADNNS